MAALDQIFAILTGRKVHDSTTGLWRVYDQYGTELADLGGILLRGLHGWLLQTANQKEAKRTGGGRGSRRDRKRVVVEVDGIEYRIYEDDLGAFLAAIKANEPIEQKPIRKKKHKKVNAPTKIVLHQASPEIRPILQYQIDQANAHLLQIWQRIYQRQIEEEEENILWLMVA